MPSCAVAECKSYSRRTKGSDIRYFTFPRNEDIQKKWIIACQRNVQINVNHARICSRHFSASSFKTILKHQLLDYHPKNCRILKDDAIPTENLPERENKTTKRKQELGDCNVIKTPIKKLCKSKNCHRVNTDALSTEYFPDEQCVITHINQEIEECNVLETEQMHLPTLYLPNEANVVQLEHRFEQCNLLQKNMPFPQLCKKESSNMQIRVDNGEYKELETQTAQPHTEEMVISPFIKYCIYNSLKNCRTTALDKIKEQSELEHLRKELESMEKRESILIKKCEDLLRKQDEIIKNLQLLKKQLNTLESAWNVFSHQAKLKSY